MRYKQVVDGERVRPAKGYKVQCCDCGLVHTMQFWVVKGHVEFSVTRDNRATGQVRRFLKTGV